LKESRVLQNYGVIELERSAKEYLLSSLKRRGDFLLLEEESLCCSQGKKNRIVRRSTGNRDIHTDLMHEERCHDKMKSLICKTTMEWIDTKCN
jgi:hypothetical protein